MQKHLLVYDASCGPCTKFRRSIEFLDSYGRLDYVSMTEADKEGLLRDVPSGLRYRSFHLLSPEGKVLSGAEAIPKLVALLPSGRLISKLMTSAPSALRATAFVYAVLSRLRDAGSCGARGKKAYSNETAGSGSTSIRLSAMTLVSTMGLTDAEIEAAPSPSCERLPTGIRFLKALWLCDVAEQSL